MERSSASKFRQVFRVSRNVFSKLEMDLMKYLQPTARLIRSDAFVCRQRLAITLHWLGSMGELQNTAELFGIGRSTVGLVVDQTCEAVHYY